MLLFFFFWSKKKVLLFSCLPLLSTKYDYFFIFGVVKNRGGQRQGEELYLYGKTPGWEKELEGRRQMSFPACGQRQGTWQQRVPSRRFFVLPNTPSAWNSVNSLQPPTIPRKCHWRVTMIGVLSSIGWRVTACFLLEHEGGG